MSDVPTPPWRWMPTGFGTQVRQAFDTISAGTEMLAPITPELPG